MTLETETTDNQSPLQFYLTEVKKYPALNLEQYKTLFKFLKAGSTIDDLRKDIAFERFISSENKQYTYAFQQSQTLEELAFRCGLNLVITEARKISNSSAPDLDLIQEGNIGLMQAVGKHNPELGNFPSYARWWIRGAIFKTIPELLTSTHIPSGMRRRIKTVQDIEAEFYRVLEQKPTEQELRQAVYEKTGLSDKAISAVIETISSGAGYAGSLDRSIAPDSDATLYDFVPDRHVSVEEEALIRVENEEYSKLRRPSQREAAINMGKSIPTAQRAFRKLIAAGLLPIHPRDPRTVDETGFTEHTRRLDVLVEDILRKNPKLKNKELVALLADPSRLGVNVTTLTIERSRLRLAAAGKAERRISNQAFYATLDATLEEKLKTRATYRQIAEDLNQPVRRIQSSVNRLRKNGKAESRAHGTAIRKAVMKYLEEHKGEKINRSEIARQLGVTRERIRQIYDSLQKSL